MNARTAAQEALEYVCMLEGLTRGYADQGGFLASGEVAVEGARLTDGDIWEISIGFVRPWDKQANAGVSALLVSNGGNRTVKTVSIDNESDRVLDYEAL